MPTFFESFRNSSWQPCMAVSLIGKWLLPEKYEFKIKHKNLEICVRFIQNQQTEWHRWSPGSPYRTAMCTQVSALKLEPGITLKKRGQLIFSCLCCWLWGGLYWLRWRAYVNVIMFCGSYVIIQKIVFPDVALAVKSIPS